MKRIVATLLIMGASNAYAMKKTTKSLPIPYQIENFDPEFRFNTYEYTQELNKPVKCRMLKQAPQIFDDSMFLYKLFHYRHLDDSLTIKLIPDEKGNLRPLRDGDDQNQPIITQDVFEFFSINRPIVVSGGGQGQPYITTLLHHASRSSRMHMIPEVIKRGADINSTPDSAGNTPLMDTAHWLFKQPPERSLQPLFTLLEHNADPNISNSQGKTALYFLIDNKDIPLDMKKIAVQKFLDAGAVMVRNIDYFPYESIFRSINDPDLRKIFTDEFRRREWVVTTSPAMQQLKRKLLIGDPKNNVPPLPHLIFSAIIGTPKIEGFVRRKQDFKQNQKLDGLPKLRKIEQ